MAKVEFGWSELSHWLVEATGLILSDRQERALRDYVDTLLLWNQKIGLISRNDTSRVVGRHVADALFAASQCAEGEAVVDLGSGAGFPGIPIAIVRPASRVCLIEAKAKKASFLAEAVRSSGASNAIVCNARIESAAGEARHQAQYQVAVARAWASTDEFFAAAAMFLAPGGRAIAMKSASQRGEATAAGVRHVEYELPDGSRRVLVIAKGR